MKPSAHQVIELFRAMYEHEEIGVAQDEVVSRPVSPQVKRILDSFGGLFVNHPWTLHGELVCEQRAGLTTIKQFFQSCADALPATGDKYEST